MRRVESQPAYILHSRNYRDSSMLVDFLTLDYGRVTAVVKGVRSTAKTARQRRSLLQPFIPLLISWTGKLELKTLGQFESTATPIALLGTRLFSAIYVNELLSRLLPHSDHNPELYRLYQSVLSGLLHEEFIEVVLRRFELQLLSDLGYGIDLGTELNSGQAIQQGQWYDFTAGQGFYSVASGRLDSASKALFRGEDLLAIAQDNYNPQARRTAKRLCRQALRQHLGAKPLKSRELFV